MKNQLNKNILIEDYYIVYVGSLNENKKHSHYALQITISLNNPFIIHTNNIKKIISDAVIVGSNIIHKVECNPGDLQLVILLEPESLQGEYFGRQLQSEGGIIIPKLKKGNLINKLQIDHLSPDIFNYIMLMIGFKSLKTKENGVDNRIKKVLELLPKIYNSELKVNDIADSVFLSESRFQHLFKEQMSVPFSKYLIWFKMNQAVKLILEEKKSFSYSAMEAGFTDYPYMCRTFNQFFGFRPKQLLKNSRIFQELSFFQQ